MERSENFSQITAFGDVEVISLVTREINRNLDGVVFLLFPPLFNANSFICCNFKLWVEDLVGYYC